MPPKKESKAEELRQEVWALQRTVESAFDKGHLTSEDDTGEFLLRFTEFHQRIAKAEHRLGIAVTLLGWQERTPARLATE